VPAGRFLRVLRDAGPGPGGVPGTPASSGHASRDGEDGGARRSAGWRTRAGVRQLPPGDLLTLQEGFHRAFAVGDLDIVREPAATAAEFSAEHSAAEHAAAGASHRRAEGAAMSEEEAFLLCASRDASFPYLLAAYQHFVRAGWTVTSGLKYGATYLLYPGCASAGRDKPRAGAYEPVSISSGQEDLPGAAHGHAPYAVYVVLPRLSGSAHGLAKRKRDGNEAVSTGGSVPEMAAQEGNEQSLSWAAMQSFSRLAAHVSKKAIVAYVSISGASSPAPASAAACLDLPGPGCVSSGTRGEPIFPQLHAADMKRITVQERHLNRWVPASSGTNPEQIDQ
jgi:hypothetical protein